MTVSQFRTILGACSVAAVLLGLMQAASAQSETLPYNRTNPVIYDNDGALESGFTDVYVMALASAGTIDLKGIISTCSYREERRQPPFTPVSDTEQIRERQELVEKARRSGLRHLPDVVSGGSLSLKRPASGRVEDTAPYRSPGSRLILQEAKKATPAKPLVILMGGQATCVVDAFLQDNSIADRMVLAWIAGNKTTDGGIDSREYNASIDAWATYIVFERLRVVAFPFSNDGNDSNDGFAATPKSRLGELPDTELRQFMAEARWPRGATTFSEPYCDYDAVGAFPLTRSDYVQRTKRVSYSPVSLDPRIVLPAFKEDPKGHALVVWEADPAVATDEWWQSHQGSGGLGTFPRAGSVQRHSVAGAGHHRGGALRPWRHRSGLSGHDDQPDQRGVDQRRPIPGAGGYRGLQDRPQRLQSGANGAGGVDRVHDQRCHRRERHAGVAGIFSGRRRYVPRRVRRRRQDRSVERSRHRRLGGVADGRATERDADRRHTGDAPRDGQRRNRRRGGRLRLDQNRWPGCSREVAITNIR